MTTVSTPAGPVEGSVRDGVVVWEGVRYGDRIDPQDRFAEVGSPRTAQSAVAAFPQRPGSLDALLGPGLGELAADEDAFLLKIQAPLGANGLPVVAFIPGGGFLSGSSQARWWDAPEFVRDGQVVLVTLSYRLGILGHLGTDASPDDSARPLRDLVQALRWISESIASFGGDPSNVTLAGDSAGSWYAYALSALPAASGLFRRTALASLPYESPLSAQAFDDRVRVVRELLPASLSKEPVAAVLDAQGALARAYAGKGMAIMPAASDDVPADLHDFGVSAARLHVQALTLLTTSEEAAAFLRPLPPDAIPLPAVEGFLGSRFADPERVREHLQAKAPDASPTRLMAELLTLHQFRTAALELAAHAAAAGIPSWVTHFDVQSPLDRTWSAHGLPLPFVFGNRAAWHDAPMLAGLDEERFARASAAVREGLLSFAHEGRPSLDGAPITPYDPAAPRVLRVGDEGVSFEEPVEAGFTALR